MNKQNRMCKINRHNILIILMSIVCSCMAMLTKAQSSADVFFLQEVERTIIPANYFNFYLIKNYHGYPYWTSHISNLNMQRNLLKNIDPELLVLSPLDRNQLPNIGVWDAASLDRAICINKQQADSILYYQPTLQKKWWWSKSRVTQEEVKIKSANKEHKDTLQSYQRKVYIIHAPWMIDKGSKCLLYMTVENDNGSKQEKIFIFHHIDEKWKLVNTIE